MKIAGRFCAVVTVVAGLASALSGCGVKSTPDYPPGAKHPRQYPAPLPPLQIEPDAKKTGAATTATTSRQAPSGNSGGIYQYPNSSTYRPPAPPPNPLTTR
ncbi:MAG: hypothetical protein HOH04_10935 [Rhodospirillaceae bacterium]|nr:hypothetical protein [Rhodospirillaceae bacterium]